MPADKKSAIQQMEVGATILRSSILRFPQYLWNVPLSADEDNARLHGKRGVLTTGLQLIATGHSLVDACMSFDADKFARLGKYTDDAHYLEVARPLLHNTKNL